jgi:hypothetical protein
VWRISLLAGAHIRLLHFAHVDGAVHVGPLAYASLATPLILYALQIPRTSDLNLINQQLIWVHPCARFAKLSSPRVACSWIPASAAMANAAGVPVARNGSSGVHTVVVTCVELSVVNQGSDRFGRTLG